MESLICPICKINNIHTTTDIVIENQVLVPGIPCCNTCKSYPPKLLYILLIATTFDNVQFILLNIFKKHWMDHVIWPEEETLIQKYLNN